MTTYLIINCFKMQMNKTEITGQLCYSNPCTDRVKIYPAHKTKQSKCPTKINAREFIHSEIIVCCLSLIYSFLLPLCYLQTLLILRSHSLICRSACKRDTKLKYKTCQHTMSAIKKILFNYY